MITVEYDTNNSGGHWWLTDDDWYKLEKAGWKVEWEERRFLGALAHRATIEAESVASAIAAFEAITDQDANEEGCPCCGPPHYFREVTE